MGYHFIFIASDLYLSSTDRAFIVPYGWACLIFVPPHKQKRGKGQTSRNILPRHYSNTSVRDSCRAHPRGRRRSEKNKQQKAQAEEAAGWNTLSSVFIDGQTIQTREKTDELLFVTCRHTYTIVGVWSELEANPIHHTHTIISTHSTRTQNNTMADGRRKSNGKWQRTNNNSANTDGQRRRQPTTNLPKYWGQAQLEWSQFQDTSASLVY